MKICLIRPSFGSYFQITPPLSLGYLSSSLKKSGIKDIEMIDASLLKSDPKKTVENLCGNEIPNVVGIQVYTGSQNWTKEFIEILRKNCPKVISIVGGPHITALQQFALDYLNPGYGILGEGESSLVELIKFLDGKVTSEKEITGLMYKEKGKWLHATEKYGFVRDADKIPFPDWEMLQPNNYFKYMQSVSMPLRGKNPIPILTSRGCPYQCTFCCSGVTNKRIMRYRSPENVVAEIQFLKDKYGVDEIFFSDDNLTMDIERAKKIFSLMIGKKLNIHWRAPNGIRIDRIDEELVEKMAQSGGYYVGVGIESGNTDVIKRIKKNIDLKGVKEKVELLHKYKIKVSGFFMTGILNETALEANDTLKFALSIPFDRIQVCNFVPYPGSEDFDRIFLSSNQKKYKENVIKFQKSGFIPKFQKMSLKGIYKRQRKILTYFYFRPKTLFDIIVNFKISQLKALSNHPFVQKWLSAKKEWYDD